MIDWTIAERIAGLVAGDPSTGGDDAPAGGRAAGGGAAPAPTRRPRATPPLDAPAWARESAQLVSAYTGMTPTAPLPEPEAVDRREWIHANLATMRPLLDPLASRVKPGLGPLAARGERRHRAVLAAEVGGLVGLLSQRVLGQYDLSLLDAAAPARLLLVAPNLAEAAHGLSVGEDDLVRWVTVHEVTHALQFGSVPWLRDYLGGMLRQILDGLTSS